MMAFFLRVSAVSMLWVTVTWSISPLLAFPLAKALGTIWNKNLTESGIVQCMECIITQSTLETVIFRPSYQNND
jgi:hypothetical protein